MSAQSTSPSARKSNLFRRWDGKLTSDLVLEPAKFGLGQVPKKLTPNASTTSVCGFCSTGCGLTVHLKDGAAVNLTPDTQYPVNMGMACPKGWEALTPLQADDRAATPYLRDPSGKLQPVGWAEAMDSFCNRFKEIQKTHGADSIAFISTGQMVTEEMALLGSLAKFGMGMLHGDGNTRQCMATAVAAYKQSFGFDAPPYTYADFEESDVIVLIGANLCIAHPIMWQRVLRNRRSPKIVVIDPRRTETAMNATHHYPILPKSDLSFFYAVAHVLVREAWVDTEFLEKSTEGFVEFAAHLKDFSPAAVSESCGIAAGEIAQLAKLIHEGGRVSFWWTMGVNQSHEGTRVAQAIINLALMTGNIGKPGTGANSITGQCNAMGSRLFSNTTGLLGGHEFTKPEHRAKVAGILGIPEDRIPAVNSLAYDQILEGVRSGKIRGLWVIATNTAHSWIDQNDANDLLQKLDFLVVQDMYHTTETAQAAHLVLPAAGWGEKDGTFINSERRFGLAKKVSRAPGIALADFNIFKLIAHHWGCGDMFANWSSPEATLQILGRVSKGQPCDVSGITDYRMIDRAGGIQWPLAEGTATFETERRLFADGRFYHPSGRAKFIFAESTPPPEVPDASYPFILLTGRGTSAQWHTQTRTAKSAILQQLYPKELYIEINPTDAARLGLSSGQKARVSSRRGRADANVVVTACVGPGQVFLPMHYAETNRLTYPVVDPYSRQPSYKYCAVKVQAVRA